MKRFRSRRFAMLLILMLTLSMALQGAATVAFADIPADGNNATIYITADDEYDLYLDGNLIGSANDWTTIEDYRVNLVGSYTIAVTARDTGNVVAGLYLKIDFDDPDFPDVITDESSGWQLSTESASGPWSDVVQVSYYQWSNVLPQAQWIWTKHYTDQYTPSLASDVEIQCHIDKLVYFKKDGVGPMPSLSINKSVRLIREKPLELADMSVEERERCLLVTRETEKVVFYICGHNSGNVTIDDAVLTDSLFPIPLTTESGATALQGSEWINGSDLNPGEYFGFRYEFDLTGLTPEDYRLINTATIAGTYMGIPVQATDEACVDLVDIQLDKSVSPQSQVIGGAIAYTLTVTNSGSVDLYNVVLNDEKLGLVDYAVGDIQAGGFVTLPIQNSSIPSDASIGDLILNTAKVVGSNCDDFLIDPPLPPIEVNDIDAACRPCFIVEAEDSAGVLVVAPPTPTEVTVVVTPDRDRADPAGSFIPPEPVPLAAPVIISAPPAEQPVIMEEEVIPLGVPVLPKTAELPVELFYGLGGMLTALGAYLKRR